MGRAGVQEAQLLDCGATGIGRPRLSKGAPDPFGNGLAAPTSRTLDLGKLLLVEKHLEPFMA